MRIKRFLTVCTLAACLAIGALAQRTIPLSLEGLVRQAGVIVQGRVIATETGRDPRTGLPATWTTVEVRENFYGASSSSVRFKQYGGEVDGMVTRMPDIPRFQAGDEVILMLWPPSEETGFQSPVGLAQGVFRVWKKNNSKRVTQSLRSDRLLRTSERLLPSGLRDGSLDSDEFSRALRRLVQEVKQ
ncbi:MAG: hypothetical protein MUE68_13295 [Bacteroidetes bacterium]|jgi:hypothetical protein|nr:hypothetical protein [Bacteroidota bacterium]